MEGRRKRDRCFVPFLGKKKEGRRYVSMSGKRKREQPWGGEKEGLAT